MLKSGRDFGPLDFQRATDVSHETMARLACYIDLLKRWNQHINLVSPQSITSLWWRHMLDSAQLFPLASPEARHWLDVGSGGGFPAMVLAIMAMERIHEATILPFSFALVESDNRKAAFLREVTRQTGAPAKIYADRVENLESIDIFEEGVDVVTARACAPLPRLLEWVLPFFGENTVGVFPVGQYIVDIKNQSTIYSTNKVQFTIEHLTSRTDPSSTILKIRRILTPLRRNLKV
ncbi:MAG: 16S rRNA (guanine(527)-N(7))-methyltransferase RsmG [Parvularculales bacterium]